MSLFSRLKSLTRDIGAIGSTLSGKPTGPAVTTPRDAPASTATTRKLRIASIVRETQDAVSLVFEDPSGAPIAFAPGQFFTLHVPVGDEVLKRAYSASSSALEPGRVAVTVKRVADGRVSRHIVANLREGELLDVLGPSGFFTPAPANENEPRTLVLIGGGSGVTPLASIARTLLASEPATRIVLVYGNRAVDHIIFKDAFAALSEAHGAERFTVRHVLEEPPAGWTGGSGRLDRAALAAELDALGDRADAEYFLCGPEPMMTEARACLEGRGVVASRIREEKFVSAHATATPRVPQEVTVIFPEQGQRKFVVSAGRTVLESALDAGVDMPFSCAVGGCGTCRVRLRQGSVVMDEPNCLSPGERGDGYVLACVSRPTSPCTLEVP